MALADLNQIRTLVRQLTRTPSPNQISDTELDQNINTFVLYDFPQSLRLYNLRSTFTFYTEPNVDVYSTNTTDNTNALFNFKNKIVAIHPQIYIAGVPVFYTQDRDVFFGTYPIYNAIFNQVAIANGTTGPFTGTLTGLPILQNNVIFSTVTTNNTAMTLIDYPQNGATGLIGYQNIVPTTLVNFGTVNYLTGVFSVTFPNNTVNGNVITGETVPYQPGKPYAILYYDQEFTIRPVPDKAYSVQMQVDVMPTELLNASQEPNLAQWWQYIAYGAARKVFQNKSDFDGVSNIDPEFKRQEGLVLSSTATIMANDRSKTIYNQSNGIGNGFGWGPLGFPY